MNTEPTRPMDRDPTIELSCPFCQRRIVVRPSADKQSVWGDCEPCDVTVTIVARSALSGAAKG